VLSGPSLNADVAFNRDDEQMLHEATAEDRQSGPDESNLDVADEPAAATEDLLSPDSIPHQLET